MNITYEQAIGHFKTPAELARALGIQPQAVYQWHGKIPPLRQYQIKALMLEGAAVSNHEANPILCGDSVRSPIECDLTG